MGKVKVKFLQGLSGPNYLKQAGEEDMIEEKTAKKYEAVGLVEILGVTKEKTPFKGKVQKAVSKRKTRKF